MTVRRAVACILALVALAAVASPAGAAETRFNPTQLYQELRCPTCDTPLDVSNAPAAQRIKAFVLERWRAGWTAQQVKDALVEDFGREVLATPPKSGFDLVAWIVPGIAVLAGLIGIVLLVRVWGRRRDGEPPPQVTDEDREALERELDRFGGP